MAGSSRGRECRCWEQGFDNKEGAAVDEGLRGAGEKRTSTRSAFKGSRGVRGRPKARDIDAGQILVCTWLRLSSSVAG